MGAGRLLDAGRIPQVPVYLDSPMAKSASDVYRNHPEAYDEETAALLRAHEAPLDYPGQHIVQNVQESERIAQAPSPYMIASNGMLTGGRSVGHAERLLDDPSATVLFVGYQGEGTLGGHLVRGAETARIAGNEMPVKATIRSLDGFPRTPTSPSCSRGWAGSSAAAGRRPGRAARRVPRPRRPAGPAALAPKVEALGPPREIPAWHQTVSLD